MHEEVQMEVEKTSVKAIHDSIQSLAQIDIRGHLQSIGHSKDSMLLAVYGEKDDVVDPSPMHNLNGNWPMVRSIGLSESRLTIWVGVRHVMHSQRFGIEGRLNRFASRKRE